jgi:hypothetical protein
MRAWCGLRHRGSLHDAAVDEDPGRIGLRALRCRDQYVAMIINEPESYRPGGDQFEGIGLEERARPPRQTSESQPLELGRWPHTEDVTAYVQLTWKCQYAGPARLRDLLGAASELRGPTHGSVRSGSTSTCGAKKVGPLSARLPTCRLERQSLTLRDRVADQIAHYRRSPPLADECTARPAGPIGHRAAQGSGTPRYWRERPRRRWDRPCWSNPQLGQRLRSSQPYSCNRGRP